MMRRWMCLALSLLMLAFCASAWAESGEWKYDADYAILRGYEGEGGDVVVPGELEGYTVDVIDINVFNAGKKREEAIATLKQLLPQVESFQTEIQRMQAAADAAQHQQRRSDRENETLKDELTAERRKSAEQRAKLAVLEGRYKRAEKLLDGVPKELLKQQMDSRQER